MNRQQSLMLKGVAIMFMLFYHLFNQLKYVTLCKCYLSVGEDPLVYVLSRATNPVAFFLILGGYGMFKVWRSGDRHRWTRIFKLYLHFWLIMAGFVAIGHFVNPDKYPGSWFKFFANMSSVVTTYNGEMWFLFPYVVLSLISSWIFRNVKNIRAVYVVAGAFMIHMCTSFLISRYGISYIYARPFLCNGIYVFHLLFNFMLGAMVAREKFFEKLNDRLEGWRRKYVTIALWGG